MKNRKSFTLMELLVVITIIAVLAAVSIPQVIGVIQRAQDAAIRMNMRVMLTEATRISILEGDLSRIHCNTGGHPDILAICDTVRAHSPHPAQLRSSATTRTFWIRAPLHDGTFWRVDHTGFAGRDLGDYIARWDMDEGSDQVVGDTTGTNPGTRGPTTAVEAQDPTWAVGHLTFDGTNDLVSHTTTGINSRQGTVEGWVNPSITSPWGGFWQTHDSASLNFLDWIAMFSWEGNFFFRMGNGTLCCNQDLIFPTATYIPAGQWSYLVFTWEGTTMNVYVNGVVIRSRTNAILQDVVNPRARIGWSHGRAMTGSIDNVRIYNRALTAEEVRASFLRGR